MSEDHPQGEDNPPVDAGHEPSEVGIRRIFLFGAGLVAMMVAVMVGLAIVMRGFGDESRSLDRSKPILYKVADGQFPAPNLQRNTTQDMKDFRDGENAALAAYGWVDRKAGIAAIPIDRALEIVAERGLPKGKPEVTSGGTTAPPVPAPGATDPSKKTGP